MAISLKYGKLDIPGIGEDEPVFILRAQDKTAADNLDGYSLNASLAGCKGDLIGMMDDVEEQFENWQEANSNLVKLPD